MMFDGTLGGEREVFWYVLFLGILNGDDLFVAGRVGWGLVLVVQRGFGGVVGRI
jgi:hypothetical protein